MRPQGSACVGEIDTMIADVYRRNEYPLRCFAVSLLDSPYERSFAEDVVHDAFALLITRSRRGSVPERPVGFLYRAVRYLASEATIANGTRKQRHVKTFKASPTPDAGDWRSQTTLDECENAEQRASLLAALRVLPPLERDVHLRVDYRGDSYDDVANELGLHHAKVALTLFQARNRLAWIMETGKTKGMPQTGYRKSLVGAPARSRKTPHANEQQRASLVKARAALAERRARRGLAQTQAAVYARTHRARKREEAISHHHLSCEDMP